jgi:hypothetical protein
MFENIAVEATEPDETRPDTEFFIFDDEQTEDFE